MISKVPRPGSKSSKVTNSGNKEMLHVKNAIQPETANKSLVTSNIH